MEAARLPWRMTLPWSNHWVTSLALLSVRSPTLILVTLGQLSIILYPPGRPPRKATPWMHALLQPLNNLRSSRAPAGCSPSPSHAAISWALVKRQGDCAPSDRIRALGAARALSKQKKTVVWGTSSVVCTVAAVGRGGYLQDVRHVHGCCSIKYARLSRATITTCRCPRFGDSPPAGLSCAPRSPAPSPQLAARTDRARKRTTQHHQAYFRR